MLLIHSLLFSGFKLQKLEFNLLFWTNLCGAVQGRLGFKLTVRILEGVEKKEKRRLEQEEEDMPLALARSPAGASPARAGTRGRHAPRGSVQSAPPRSRTANGRLARDRARGRADCVITVSALTHGRPTSDAANVPLLPNGLP